MTSRVEIAQDCFREGFNCSQAVFSTFGGDLGIDRELALRVGCAFGAGMGRLGEACGAVTGAFMVIGLRQGSTRASDKEAKERTYALVCEFAVRFRARHGSINCRDLLGCDLQTEAGKKFFNEHNLLEESCCRFVGTAAEILEQLLP